MLHQRLDRTAIDDVLQRYCWYTDMRRIDDQVRLFTEDCRLQYKADTWMVGREALANAMQRSLSVYDRTCHLVAPPRTAGGSRSGRS